jgi:hypothetical protein
MAAAKAKSLQRKGISKIDSSSCKRAGETKNKKQYMDSREGEKKKRHTISKPASNHYCYTTALVSTHHYYTAPIDFFSIGNVCESA